MLWRIAQGGRLGQELLPKTPVRGGAAGFPTSAVGLTELLTSGQIDAISVVQENFMVTRSSLSSSTNPRGAGGATIIGAKMRNDDGPGPQVMDAATLIGDQVVNVADEDLGKIEGIMLDVSAGRTAYAALSSGGFLGMGNKLFAIPWSALTLAAMERFLRRPTKCK